MKPRGAVFMYTPQEACSAVFDVVRLAAHVSNGCKSQIRPVAGKI